jgi:exodeoxyribonuclease V beta subunit
MQTFNPLTIPLSGQQLIEASAGTGKTYSIALLYLRLIVEGNLDVDKILVVTFTTSATEELRQRIRLRLREALDVLEATGDGDIACDDKVLMGLLGSLENRPEAVQRLTDTLVRMDESAVFTIHSFCQRMLQDHAFESGAPFDTEFIESEQQLRREIIRDFWRQRFYPASSAETAWATSTWDDPEGLGKVLNALMTQSGVEFIPEVSREEVDSLQEESISCLQAVLHAWTECGDEIADILRNDSCLSRDKKKGYGLERVELVLAGMDELALQREPPWLLPDGVELLAASVMAEKLKGKKIAPEHPFFTLFDTFFQNNEEFIRLAGIHVIISAYQFLRTELETRKRDRGQMYFDDLLTNLDRALTGSDGDMLVQRIRERFTVALVDEFQDTDPLQYRIFRMLFGKRVKNPGLFMIGDPKQSIYSFRGADVFAYIQAKNGTSKSASFTMDTNYRSTSFMVHAVNKLFDSENSFIFGDDIPFSVVKSGGKADEEPFVIQNASPEPLQAMVLPVEKFAAKNRKDISKELAGIAASQWTAMEIARLLQLAGQGKAKLGEHSLTGGDLAVLVRTHREAAMIQQDLARLRIASVYYSQDSVFASDEALELHLVLTALLDLSVMRRVNSALVTGLFGLDAHDLEQMQADAAKWDEMIGKLEAYHVRWRNQGVAAMLQKLLSGQQVVQRLISLPGGERKLTNYLHLAELLQDASEHQAGMDGLVRWFGIQRHDPEETSSGQQLRLESDENLVRIVTVHKAKGLEYPVVFVTVLWDCRSVKNDVIFYFYR